MLNKLVRKMEEELNELDAETGMEDWDEAEDEAVLEADGGPITRWIEKYFEEKLDKRDRSREGGGPGAELDGEGKKRWAKLWAEQLAYLN